MNFVVTLQEGENGQFVAHLSRSELQLNGADVVRSIPLDVAGLDSCNTREGAERYGKAIQQALGSHPAIGKAIERLYEAGSATPARLMFEIRAPKAEGLKWEALCDEEHGFAAIDLRANVARVAAHASAASAPPRVLSWPIRIAAFLSPAGISSASEMNELITVVNRARAAGLSCMLDLYLGEPDLLKETRDKIAAGALLDVAASPIPAEATEFEQVIRDTNPHVLHFFCHGFSRTGLQHVEFATLADWKSGSSSGSSLLSIERLTKMAGLRRSWLAVLNCCRGANSFEQAHSMAYALVAEGGCPTAVGMNEPIEVVDAVAFARVFYDKLLNECFMPLKDLAPGSYVDLDLSPAVGAARVQLYEKYQEDPPDAFGRWLMPILYVSDDPLRITHAGVDNDPARGRELEQKAEFIGKLLRELPADTPDHLRDQLFHVLEQEPRVPETMRPSKFGDFPV